MFELPWVEIGSHTYSHPFDWGALERDPGRVRLRATGNALGRLAGFLLATAQRYARLGYAPTLLVLRMTRSDIASYLFMTVETVSRALRTLEDRQLVEIDRRTVRLRDPAGLAQLTRGPE
jgi:CRP/FNR family transcriptional regulator